MESNSVCNYTSDNSYNIRVITLNRTTAQWKFDLFITSMITDRMGPLQVASHMAQKHLAGEHETHWVKTNKKN